MTTATGELLAADHATEADDMPNTNTPDEGPGKLQQWGGIVGGGTVAAVVFVLLQFGLVGSDARRAALETESRITRVETRVDSIEGIAREMLSEIRALRAQVGRGEVRP